MQLLSVLASLRFDGAKMTETLNTEKAKVEIVGASAGTGKTTRLSLEFLRAVEGHAG